MPNAVKDEAVILSAWQFPPVTFELADQFRSKFDRGTKDSIIRSSDRFDESRRWVKGNTTSISMERKPAT